MSRSAAIGRAQAGFTLVEMLVALVVFSLLAAAGVGVLRSSVDVQSRVDTRLTELGSHARLNALLSSDFAQAVVRVSRAPGGERPPFVGDAGGMEFVSGARANLDGAPRSELQRVQWRFAGRALQRTGFEVLDGADGSRQPAQLVRDVDGAAFRYRTLDGTWGASFASTRSQPMPSAVELTLTASGGPPIVMVFALPQGPGPEQPR